MHWIYVMMGIFYQTRISYLKLVSYLGLKPKLEIRYPIKAVIWRIGKWKEENLWYPGRSSKPFQKKIAYLICPDNPTFQKYNDVKGNCFYQPIKENLTNLIFLGRKETLVTAVIILYKSSELNHSRGFMEDHFSQLSEEKYACISQGKLKIGRKKYTSLRKTYYVLSYGGVFPKNNYTFCIDTIKFVSLMQNTQ